MNLLSWLFGKKEREDEPVRAPQPTRSRPEAVEAPAGQSWGEKMPAEENQYNFGGNYVNYFDHVFREDFPEYAIEHEAARGRAATVFTFTRDGRKALVVELLSESSSACKLRRDCGRENVPYLRFYYDHDGWWNTRSYVSGRVREALRG